MQSATTAKDMVLEEYPDATIIPFDMSGKVGMTEHYSERKYSFCQQFFFTNLFYFFVLIIIIKKCIIYYILKIACTNIVHRLKGEKIYEQNF